MSPGERSLSTQLFLCCHQELQPQSMCHSRSMQFHSNQYAAWRKLAARGLNRKEKTTPSGVNLMRSQVLYWAAQVRPKYSADNNFSSCRQLSLQQSRTLLPPVVAHLHMVSHCMWYLTAYGNSVHRYLTRGTNMQARQS